ncbi:MAG: carbohydrate kinase [Clostridiales Family XIII bacterium]|jgi:fructokinase|nr:carbohydrate kinase [Clostridiales Family XIII bacterium]
MEGSANLYCIGEALVDFIPLGAGDSEDARRALIPSPGGSPANTAVAAAKLGTRSHFIGKVGDDALGRMAVSAISEFGADTSLVHATSRACTTLAFVTLSPDGDRDFTFARKPGADMLLDESEIPEGIFSRGDILHFTSLGLVESPSKYAHAKAIDLAKSAGAHISFDPNIRLSLWDDPDACRRTVMDFLPKADIVKVSLDEMPFVFGTKSEQSAADYCFDQGVSAFFVTRGKDGAAAYTRGCRIDAAPVALKAIDTTGAGDAFDGAFLSRFVGRPLTECIEQASLAETLRFANCAGALTVTKKGGMSGSPTLDELTRFLGGDSSAS